MFNTKLREEVHQVLEAFSKLTSAQSKILLEHGEAIQALAEHANNATQVLNNCLKKIEELEEKIETISKSTSS